MSSKTDQVPFKGVMQVALAVLESTGSPRSLAVYILAKSLLMDSYQPALFAAELDSLGFDVNNYDQFTIADLRDDYMATALLSKLPPLPGADTSYLVSAAIEGFQVSEALNRMTNKSWENLAMIDRQLAVWGSSIESLQMIVRSVVGRAPSLKTLGLNLVWTTGSSVTLPLKHACAEAKCERGTSVTYPLAKALNTFIKDGGELSPLISTGAWFLTPGNLFDTAPKNMKTDRTIAKEADLNMLYQKAIGTTLKRRLLSCNIDLFNQAHNQFASTRCMRSESATVDMRNASNSTCRKPVYTVFPDDWVELFDVTRSHFGTFAQRKAVLAGPSKVDWFQYEMLSSMGNGFTFEVESVLFYAIAQAAGASPAEINVYGDDVILPQRYVEAFKGIAAVFGFEVNIAKSFTSGAFFESCGAYSYFGVDVSPIKIKDHLNGPKDCIILANKIRWFSHICRHLNGCDSRYLPAWQMCLHRLPHDVRVRCRGSVGSGNTLWVNRAESRLRTVYNPKKALLQGFQLVPSLAGLTLHGPGVLIMRQVQISGGFIAFESGLTLNQLLRIDDWRGIRDYLKELPSTPRGNVAEIRVSTRWVLKPVYFSEWYQLGQWS
jgi:hypothetical protein